MNKDEKHIDRVVSSMERKFFTALEAMRQEQAEQRKQDMQQIMVILQPIAETYRTASMMGKWVTSLLVFLSVLFGLLQTIKAVFHR